RERLTHAEPLRRPPPTLPGPSSPCCASFRSRRSARAPRRKPVLPRRTSSGRASRPPRRGRAPCAAPRKPDFPPSRARLHRRAPYRVVLQAQSLQLRRVVEIAPVEDRRRLQARADRLEIGAAEFLPLGDDRER